MFSDIQQLEKEIALFRKNVLASNELLQGIEAVAQAVKEQTEHQKIAASKMEKTATEQSEEMISLTSSTAKRLLDQCKAYAAELESTVSSAISQSKEQNLSLLAEAVQKFNRVGERYMASLEAVKTATEAAQGQYLATLSETVSTLRSTEEKLTSTYEAFLRRLESTNVDQIFKTCQEMKKSVELKLWILIGGVGVTAVLSLLSLIF